MSITIGRILTVLTEFCPKVLYVQEVLTHFIEYNLLHKMGQDFLDIQYSLSVHILFLAFFLCFSF